MSRMNVFTTNQPKQRQVNIELLRIVAMFMVVVLHCNAFNLKNTDPLTLNWFAVWLLENLSIVAVNCYLLISGYFLITSEFRWKKLFSIWLQVIFYSIGFYVVIGLIYGWESFITLIYSIFPVSTRSYWFATTYLVLYALSPFLNIAIKAMSKLQMQCSILVLIIIFCIWPSVVYPYVQVTIDPSHGHGIIWFVVLYAIAAYLRLYNPRKRYSKLYLLGYLFITAVAMLLLFLNQIVYFPWIDVLLYYNSMGVFFSSLLLFEFFLTVKINNIKVNKIVPIISSLTFGVYLIHENFLVREHLYTDILDIPSYANTSMQIIYTIGSAILIYVIASLIEFLRQKLFARLRIDVLAQKMDHWVTSKITRLKSYLI
ncbi:MAG: acyltransferase family protein [Rikenellaceae bacterium]|nr:acyltransferase family protein [Rikenellaceae bacterium]MBR2419672.1 acyltransferase family protein [Rikenellaceae bacterium]MBR3801702.1 acyltransferase family protein [Rikenellaceae bacterium]